MMQTALNPSIYASDIEGQGLSDERESERWAEAMGGQEGLGETVAELEGELKELGLR